MKIFTDIDTHSSCPLSLPHLYVHFQSEPLCEYLGSLKSVFNDVIVLRTVQLGMSFEAIDTTKNDQRVGVFLTAPAAKGVTSELDLELEQLEIDDQMEKIGGFLDYAKSIVEPMMKSDVYLEGVIMSVLPGYGGQGIGKRLLHAVEEMAVEMGLPLIYVGCTSEYSARVVAKCGFQEVYHLRYDAYLKEGVQVFDPRPPHDTFRAYIKLLG